MKGIRIETPRLFLREYEWSDLHHHHTLISDPDIMYYIQDVFTHSLAESRENLRQAILAIAEPARSKIYLVIQTREGSYVGGIGYTVSEESPAGKRVEIGYFTDPEYWGKGYVREALGALMEYAFTRDGVYRIDGTCIQKNTRSARVMERCGMRPEGVRRAYEWHVDSLKSRCYYGLLKEEWEENHNGSSKGHTTTQECATV
ncbi:MAG TPA: GNAT family N-acetyltransferase [Clostridiales bacterium]|nr:GNAT family N-acetyltransferase [Clostridiales bacterium]